jgi:hypothetical protein
MLSHMWIKQAIPPQNAPPLDIAYLLEEIFIS